MNVMDHLARASDKTASDLFLIAGARPTARIDGRMDKYGNRLSPSDSETLVRELYTAAERDIARFEADGDDDFSFIHRV